MELIKKKFNTKRTDSGVLTFLESERDVPFAVKRVYYIYDLAQEAHRGFHAHKALRQYLICVHGKCEILLDDGVQRKTVLLSDPSEGLYVGSGIWREMYAFSHEAVLLVLASEYFDESDYIRDYDLFLQYVNENLENCSAGNEIKSVELRGISAIKQERALEE